MRRLPAARRRRRGARRARALGRPRPRRLPHARVLRGRPRRGVRAPVRRRDLRGAARRGRGDPLDRAGDARGRGGRARACARAPRRLDAPGGTTTFEAKSGYGLDRDTELAQLRAIRAAGGVPTWLGAHAVPPEFAEAGADAYLDFLLSEVLPDARSSRRPRTSSSSAAPSTSSRPVATSRRAAPPARAPAARRPVHRARRRRSRGRARRPLRRPPRGDGPVGVAALAASAVTGVLLPASALFLGRPMPPARALVDAGAAIALATDFNPGSAFCESLPLVCSLACTQLHLTPPRPSLPAR